MGYDFHITRAEHWINSNENPISAQEWLEIIKEDPDLIPSTEHGEYFVIWRGTTQYPETWFNWQDGHIYTKNPDKATLRKLYQMAQRLEAHLLGDDGEIWGDQDIEVFADAELEKEVIFPKPKKANNGLLARIKRTLERLKS
jgi:hypothetical protein